MSGALGLLLRVSCPEAWRGAARVGSPACSPRLHVHPSLAPSAADCPQPRSPLCTRSDGRIGTNWLAQLSKSLGLSVEPWVRSLQGTQVGPPLPPPSPPQLVLAACRETASLWASTRKQGPPVGSSPLLIPTYARALPRCLSSHLPSPSLHPERHLHTLLPPPPTRTCRSSRLPTAPSWSPCLATSSSASPRWCRTTSWAPCAR